MTTKQIVLASRPKGMPTLDNSSPGGVFIAGLCAKDETPAYNAMRILGTHPCNLNSIVNA